MSTEIMVRDYIQVAHRLTSLPGKCQRIHGHSMLVSLHLRCKTNDSGLAVDTQGEVLDFSAVKVWFRNHLSAGYDHHLLLNTTDVLWALSVVDGQAGLPGAVATKGDPTVENIAKWICEAAHFVLGPCVYKVEVRETETNAATYRNPEHLEVPR